MKTFCVRSLQSGKYQRNKINAILTDSRSNIMKVFRNWLRAIQGDNEEEEEQEFSNDPQTGSVAFSLHKRLSCFSCILQLVMCKFNTITSPNCSLQSASRLTKEFQKWIINTKYCCDNNLNYIHVTISRNGSIVTKCNQTIRNGTITLLLHFYRLFQPYYLSLKLQLRYILFTPIANANANTADLWYHSIYQWITNSQTIGR